MMVMSKLRYILYILLLAVLTGCTDVLDVFSDGEINAGDEVQLSARVPQVASRGAKEDYETLINKFEHVQEDYVFDVSMYEEGNQKIGSAIYNPTKNTVDNVITYDEYGTLKQGSNYLYWPSNVKKYAFHAVSSNSSASIEPSQDTFEKYLNQDRIEGYGYVPGWDNGLNDGVGAPIRNLDDYNYLTAKEWYAANKAWGAPGELTQAQLVEYWKKIPLYMRHKRSRITVRLKAGEGVEREQIKYDAILNPQNIHTEIYSYDKDNNKTVVNPLLGSYNCQYSASENVVTACYDAIVNPHNYAEGSNITDQKILYINLSGMKFSFYAANDAGFSSSPTATNDDVKARYNLTEGKHLILDVLLSTDTRKILITAYVVDWEDWPFRSICDDFGQGADPMPIKNKKELIEFLKDPNKNKAGNVGVIMPLDFNIMEAFSYTQETADEENKEHMITDKNGKKPGEKDYITTYEEGYTPVVPGEAVPAGWYPEGLDLKATLKLAGAKITTNQRLFDKISPSGALVNGTVVIADQNSNEEPIECAIALRNEGMIDRVNVEQGDTERKATRAGLVITNNGTINACSSTMPVYNDGSTEVFIGGIAAEMEYPTIDGHADKSTLPVISQCYVDARIHGDVNVKGGGIVGKADGKVTINVYEYGITMSQSHDRFKNIIFTNGNEGLEAYGNEWSTKVENSLAGTNARPAELLYNQVIDSQSELKTMINTSTYNASTCRFRIANSFTVDDTWNLGMQNLATNDARNLYCELDGNDKTITLTGTTNAKMLFSNIESSVYDLTIVLDKPIIARPDATAQSDEGKLPARAPLAYAAVGEDAVITNVKVLSNTGAYVESAASGGMLVWAYDGATIQQCMSDVDVRIALPEGTGEQQTYFVGGLVNSAAKANIQQCTYLRDELNSGMSHATATSNIYYGGIVGGTSTKGTASPHLNISDCASWLTWTVDDAYPHTAWGGIIGYSKYQNPSSELVTSMDGNCQGNWWAAPAGASAKGWATGMTEEKVIGKKNSVDPTKPTDLTK